MKVAEVTECFDLVRISEADDRALILMLTVVDLPGTTLL